jgi:hypothetical protein
MPIANASDSELISGMEEKKIVWIWMVDVSSEIDGRKFDGDMCMNMTSA